MSRGPGKIERAIGEAFKANPHLSYSVGELATIAYPGINCVEKKHRVAIIRAADNAAFREGWTTRFGSDHNKLFYGNKFNYESYVAMRLRAWRFRVTEEDVSRWREDVDFWIAERDGDEATVIRMRAEEEKRADFADRQLAIIKSAIKKR